MTIGEDVSTLDADLLDAHRAGDRQKLVTCYEQAARQAETDGRDTAAGFYMTHAYVFALEAGLNVASRLKAWLVASGRESET